MCGRKRLKSIGGTDRYVWFPGKPLVVRRAYSQWARVLYAHRYFQTFTKSVLGCGFTMSLTNDDLICEPVAWIAERLVHKQGRGCFSRTKDQSLAITK